MGHVRLGNLPHSKRWEEVVAQLGAGFDAAAIAAAAGHAAETQLVRGSADPAFQRAFWLLTQIPLAARGPDFAADLARLGITVPAQPGLLDVVAGLTTALDNSVRVSGRRSDFGEMAQLAAAETLADLAGRELPSLFGASPADAKRAIGRYASGQEFSRLARSFFARLLQRSLDYYLSRELNRHVGVRFANDRARAAFDEGLRRHCHETTRIIGEFAGGWYGKRVYQGPGIRQADIEDFAGVAFRKLRAELVKRRDA